ncbi:hypothetical protein RHMOL_Rhmol13G0287100 [Rhododendron molle]|uniref:Uncharacterized protein n=1 Tax=Rhododendron molle TaxID=49168 RepID=A0ACC0LC53_RHOML|nr:hypothetical protein RHMOL_Rhmol13G0287100 [Rhododendron molle]
MFLQHQVPPADLIADIHAALTLRLELQQYFDGLLPLVHFEQRNAVILVGSDVRAIYRAMQRSEAGSHFWAGAAVWNVTSEGDWYGEDMTSEGD